MISTLSAPSKYIQGQRVLEDLYSHIEYLGKRFIVLADELVYGIVASSLSKGLDNEKVQWKHVVYNGESTLAEGQRIAGIVREYAAEGIIGIGGGKVLDSTKLAGNIARIPVIAVPTIAASDAPCSGRSVIYDEEGEFVVSKKMDKNPEIVMVDTEILLNAPIKTFISGIGDAFSTFYEARACRASGAMNYTGGKGTTTAFANAVLCRNILIENGPQSIVDAREHRWSEAFENVIEANIYLSGVGFENNGCAIAHAIYNGMTAAIKPLNVPHGIGVAYGTIIQLIAENDKEELEIALDLFKKVGLPHCLKDMDIDPTEEIMKAIAEKSCTVSPNAHKMPFVVSPELLYNAIFNAENL